MTKREKEIKAFKQFLKENEIEKEEFFDMIKKAKPSRVEDWKDYYRGRSFDLMRRRLQELRREQRTVISASETQALTELLTAHILESAKKKTRNDNDKT